ncbi:uncharacterized protein LOC131322215 isoform X5 [Rhododendron vialii]|uniref:uncharacterized protein LOC131322215 isoform X5 n=1 Tax=Rhododendron vialii TaxID=182163 RepID=UPI00265F01DC|nr:uncharacterized protein LOC131322215 isoform X5 [Rhododendron vialii]
MVKELKLELCAGSTSKEGQRRSAPLSPLSPVSMAPVQYPSSSPNPPRPRSRPRRRLPRRPKPHRRVLPQPRTPPTSPPSAPPNSKTSSKDKELFRIEEQDVFNCAYLEDEIWNRQMTYTQED